MIFLVHSMGRVGSATIYRSLKRAGYEAYHFHYMDKNPEMKCFIGRGNVKIISPIREPVRRNISAYFKNVYLKNRYKNKVRARHFIAQYHHYVPLEWLDKELKYWWGVDVYSEPFPDCGWKVYSNKILVIRARDIDSQWHSAFLELTGLDAPYLRRENVRRLPEYKRFLREETIPQEYIDLMHDSRYYRHFFA